MNYPLRKIAALFSLWPRKGRLVAVWVRDPRTGRLVQPWRASRRGGRRVGDVDRVPGGSPQIRWDFARKVDAGFAPRGIAL